MTRRLGYHEMLVLAGVKNENGIYLIQLKAIKSIYLKLISVICSFCDLMDNQPAQGQAPHANDAVSVLRSLGQAIL